MRIDRRHLLGGLAALPLAGLGPRAALAQKASLNYWHHFTSTTEFKGLEKVLALFKQKYPDIAVTQENIPNPEYMSKMTAAVVANAKPDTCMVVAERASDLVAMGALTDLTDRIKAWPRFGDYPAQAWSGCTVGGKLYGIPAFTFVDWMYYRKDWFAEKGIAPPTTMKEFMEAAIKLSDPAKNRYGFSLRGGAGGFKYVIDLIEGWGSPLVVDGKMAIDKAKATEAVAFYAELLTKHKAVPPSAPSDGYRQIMEAFKTGQTGMVWHHTGSLTEIQAALKPEQFATLPMPAGPAAHIARLTYLFNGVANPAKIDADMAWISYWADPEPAIAFLEETGYFPSSPKVAADERIVKNPLYAAAVETTKFGRLPPTFVGVAGWSETVVLPEFQKVLVGRSTPAQAVDAMMAGLETALK
ncbi:MAG: sugar ABC transporter substrate-binding protein [Alsobacter sp.]